MEAGKPKNIIIRGYPNRLGLEELEDTKGEIKVRISKMNRQHNGQKNKYKGTNSDPQSIHIQLKIELHEPH